MLTGGSGSGSGGSGKNYIVNGDASSGTTGWITYTSVLSVTAANVDTGADTFTITAHGLQNGQRVQFTTSNTLPSPLAANTDYYVLSATANTFQVTATVGGAAVNLTTQGTGTHSVKPARPVTVSGTSTAVQIFSSTTNPLEGLASFLVQRTSPSMGEGVYRAFTIDTVDQARVIQLSFDYKYDSGTYNNVNSTPGTDSDMIVMIQDVTNGTFIQPSNLMIDGVSSAVAGKYTATFQTASNSTSYRLLIHSAFDLRTSVFKMDNVKASPQDYAFGSPISGVIDAGAITIGATTTAPTKGTILTDKVRYYRSGKYAIINYQYAQSVAGIVGSGDYLVSLPPGLVVDTSITPAFGSTLGNADTNTLQRSQVGDGHIGITGGSRGPVKAFLYSSTQISLAAAQVFTTYTGFSSAAYSLANANLGFSFTVQVPIVGWDSSVQMSSETSTRVVDLVAIKNGGAVTANTTIPTWTTVSKDSHGAFNSSTGVYTVPVPGDYSVNVTAASSGTSNIKIRKNGTDIAYGPQASTRTMCNTLIPNCVIGDTITVVLDGSQTLVSDNISNVLCIHRISGPSQIAASDLIAYSGYLSADTSFGLGVSVKMSVTDLDTHGAYNTTTGLYTCPAPGIYRVSAGARYSAGSGSGLEINKNGAAYARLDEINGSTANAGGSITIQCNQGDTLGLFSGNTTTWGGLLSGRRTTHLSIERLGNRG
jgi:hypothetical protein